MHLDRLADHGREAVQFHGDAIVPEISSGAELAAIAGDHRVRGVGPGVDDGDGHAGKHAARGVDDAAADGAAGFLACAGGRAGDGQHSRQNEAHETLPIAGRCAA